MADAFDSGEGLSIEGETVDLNQLKGLFTEWLDSDVQDGIYRCVGFRSLPRKITNARAVDNFIVFDFEFFQRNTDTSK